MMKKLKNIGLAFMIMLAFTAVTISTGCASKNLDPTGVYQGDRVLYEAENAINTFHATARTFLVWEKDFRSVLPVKVSRAADFIRLNEQRWLDSAHALHDAYVRTPTVENKDKLQLGINLLRSALNEAAVYMAASEKVAPNNGLPGIKLVTAGQ